MSDSTAPNPYAAPSANLQELPANTQVPSIAEALSRGYDYSIGDLLSEAWQRVKGTKGIIFGGFVIFYIAMVIVTTILGAILGAVGIINETSATSLIVGQFAVSIFGSALTYPLLAGLNIIGIRRAADQPVSFNDIFSPLSRFVPLMITALLMTVLIYIGMLLLLIPGIYLGVAYLLAIPLVAERGLSPWQAMETSRQAISQHWFKTFFLFIVLGLIMVVSMLPLGVGLIWTMPLFVISVGVLYRTIFGVLPPAN